MARKLKLNTACCTCVDAPWDAEQVLADALAERALFLEHNPHHQQFQVEIDRMLDNAGDAEGRMTVLAILMEAKLIELSGQLKMLNGILLRSVSNN